MYVVHHLENSRSQRVLWMLEELEFTYEVVRYDRRPDMRAPEALRRIHPLGKSPVVEDRKKDGRSTVLVETGAICEYLVDKANGRLGPPEDGNGRRQYRQFVHYAEGSVMPILFAVLVASKVPLLGRLAANKVRPMLDVHLDYIEKEISSRPWFAGKELTAADIMMSFPLEAARKRGGLDQRYPATIKWLDTIHQRPAYQKALKRGGNYAFAS
ncbi:glutathione S-transferase family protein [Endobacterium cereale]|uniref:glutathione S-transferase family protein n=1 Tax=Endobacterium cereale TaxID=2663029 RepID=UPI002B46A04C|nr:glutathione S-transferase [Endobacterium cereale]MEB2848540.1 glutathione S-transferase [Endobacterium cereale]